MPPFLNQYVELVPAQMRLGQEWYRGTADAIYQNVNLIRNSRATLVAVFGAAWTWARRGVGTWRSPGLQVVVFALLWVAAEL